MARNPTTTRGDSANLARANWPRYANAMVGAWLFISAFAWPHADASRTNTWVIGLIAVIVSLWAVATPAVRYVNTAVAVWLFFTTITFPHILAATTWNNVIAAVVIFMLSLVPSRRPGRPIHA